MPERKYAFSWDLIGNLDIGRPNLGPTTRLEVYRLMQYAFRDVMERHLGAAKTDAIFYEAGYLAGQEVYKQFLTGIKEFGTFLNRLQTTLKELSIGIMRVEKADLEKKSFVITMSEDLDCSGLPERDFEVCVYDEGFLAALLDSFTGERFAVKEIDCWCTGDRTCRFTAEIPAGKDT
ncbi:MAG: V4R domain-containing protein [Thermodesulfobacteriota bacterium]|nr:4-vinyl reductase [Desulfovibrio sp.]